MSTEERNNKNTNWKVKCERMTTEKRDSSTDGDNPVIFNTDTNQYEGWNGTEWIALAGGGSGPGGDITVSNGLNKDGDDIRLGGNLNFDTLIPLNGNDFAFEGVTSSMNISEFSIGMFNSNDESQSDFVLDNGALKFTTINKDTFNNSQFTISSESPFGDGLRFRCESDGLGESVFGVGSANYIGFNSENGGGSIAIDLGFRSDGIKINDTLFGVGLIGGSDFSANYTDNSYIQKKWAEDNFSATLAGQGLTKDGSTINLGGDVTSGVNLNLADPLADFIVGAKNNNVSISDSATTFTNQQGGVGTLFDLRIDDTEISMGSSNSNGSNSRITIDDDAFNRGIDITSTDGLGNTNGRRSAISVSRELGMYYFNLGDVSSISTSDSLEGFVVSDNISQKGLVGNEDFSANYDDFTYVQKKYVDDAISQGGGDVTASNGLTKVGDDIKLGGELTEFTILDSRDSLILRSSETDDGSTPSFSMVINGEETLLSATRPDAGNNLAEISFLNSDFEGTSLQLRTQDDTTNNLCRLDVKGKELSLSSSLNNIQKRAISIDQVNSGILMEDSENQKGLVGAEDYSANYDDNTYVQKKYVDDKTDKGYQEFTFSFQEGVIIGDSIIKILKSDFDGMTVTVERDEVGKYIFTLSQSIFEDEGREGIFTSGMFFSKAVAYPDDTNKIALEIRDRETNSLADGLGQTVIIEARTYNI